MSGLLSRDRFMPLMPALGSIVLLLAAGYFMVIWKQRSTAQNLSADYLAYASHWAEDMSHGHKPPPAMESPWGGSYVTVEKIPAGGPALLISCFPPHTRSKFDEADRERLLIAWQAHPINKTRLVFHFNGLPALILVK